MPKFRKKPVEIEAVQWNPDARIFRDTEPLDGLRGTHYLEVSKLMGGTSGCTRYEPHWDWAVCAVMETPEGLHVVSPGDWIITGVKGERYPCKPDIFAATYDAVGEAE